MPADHNQCHCGACAAGIWRARPAKFASPRATRNFKAAWAILGAHLHGLARNGGGLGDCRRHRHPGEYTREALT